MSSNIFKDVQDSLESFLNHIKYDDLWAQQYGQILSRLNDRLTECQQVDLPNNKLRLFCRQLKRLMDNNRDPKRVYRFWDNIFDYISYVLDESDTNQLMTASANLSEKRLRFEEELEKREQQSKQKSFDEFVEEHKESIDKYFEQCQRFHSTLQVTPLIDNIDEFIRQHTYLKDLSLDTTTRQHIENKLKTIEIRLPFLNRNFEDKSHIYSDDDNKEMNTNVDEFLTSNTDELMIHGFVTENIGNVLKTDRWIVILGDPANGKTTLLKSIVNIFCQFRDRTFRIPIFIRISEFVSWLQDNPNKQFIDFIESNGNMFKELIFYGHALILLDGLDEIHRAKDRKTIVDLIKQFIDIYAKDPTFVSAFDQNLFDGFQNKYSVDEIQRADKRGGNQIIITSRIIGYDINPLVGPFIKHYVLSDNNNTNTIKAFANNWMVNIDAYLRTILAEKQIVIDEQIAQNGIEQKINMVVSICEKKKRLFLNFASLNIICAHVYRSVDGFDPQSQIEMYDTIIQSAFLFWRKQDPTLSQQLLNEFLLNFSIYLHLKSSTGLMDTFNITQLARLIVQQQQIGKMNSKYCEYIVDKLLKVLQSNSILISERGLEVYGFSHLLYQEYFVAQFLVKGSLKEIVNRFIFYSMNPRFHNSISLALSWINWKWSNNDFNEFYTELVSTDNNYCIPLGAILIFHSFDHHQQQQQRLIPHSALFTALNNILHSSVNKITTNILIPFLCKLPSNIVEQWITIYLKSNRSLPKFCQCLLDVFVCDVQSSTNTKQINNSILSVICQQLHLLAQDNQLDGFIINQTFQRIKLLFRPHHNISSYEWISTNTNEQQIWTSTMNPFILSIIIIVQGGLLLDFNPKSKFISWSNQRIYRQSQILNPIVEYLTNDNQSHSVKLQRLIEQYTNEVEQSSIDDLSDKIVDTFVALICLHSMTNIEFINKYLQYKAFSLAFNKIKQSVFFMTTIFHELSISTMKQFTETIQSTIDIFHLSTDQQILFPWTKNIFCELKSKLIFNKLSEEEEDISNESSLFVTFYVPFSLRKLYYHLFINQTDETDSLPFVIFLAECSLMYLKHVDTTHFEQFKSQCEQHFLDNYLSVILNKRSIEQHDFNQLIAIERQRIADAIHLEQSEHRDCRLFATAISLAQIQQNSSCVTISNEEILNVINNIRDPMFQMISWHFLSEIQQTYDYDSIIVNRLKAIQRVPSMTLTFLITRLSKQRKDLQMIYLIVKLIGQTPVANNDIKHALTIALKHCEHLYYLVQSFDPTQWNSMLLFRHFNDEQISFESSDNTFLSLMYITQLAFQSHILQRLLTHHIDIQMKEIMTYENAIWITNYLQNSWNDTIIDKLIQVVFQCLTVEEKALPILKQWYIFRYENKLKIFSQYAALQRFIQQGANDSESSEIINDILLTDDEIYLNCFLEQIFNSQMIDMTILTQIFQIWHKNHYYSSKISIWIRRRSVFDLILKLEHERIVANESKPCELPYNSFFFVIKGCSPDLQDFIQEYLRTLIVQSNQQQYVTTIIKWIFNSQIWSDTNKPFSKQFYDYIFSLLDDYQQSRDYLHKIILLSLQSIVSQFEWKNKKHLFITTHVISHLDKIICSYEKYPNDILSVCLLTYGIYFDRLIQMNETYCVFNEIPHVLTRIFNLKLSELISNRAGLCLIIIAKPKEWPSDIPVWFKEKYSLTAEDEYNMLLQATLFGSPLKNIFQTFLLNQSDKIIDKFVCELKTNLENKYLTDDLCDPSPDYISLALNFVETESTKFVNALKRKTNSIDENKLRTNLYSCAKYAKSLTDYRNILQFYETFGLLTEELSEMLKWMKDRFTKYEIIWFDNLKDISNRQVILNLFDLLKSFLNETTLEISSIILELLIKLTKIDLISFIEIHQSVLTTINDFSHQNQALHGFCRDSIFDSILDLSIARDETFLDLNKEHFNFKRKQFFSINEIDSIFDIRLHQFKHSNS